LVASVGREFEIISVFGSDEFEFDERKTKDLFA
jgi:hypothetical protein